MSRVLVVIITAIVLSLCVAGCRSEENAKGYVELQGDSIALRESQPEQTDNRGGMVSPPEGNASDVEKKVTEGTKQQQKPVDNTNVAQANPKPQTGIEWGYNQKLSWSVVRSKNHLLPGFESKRAGLADKYNAIYLGDKSIKRVYLTFDEGYENGYTPKILDTLKQHNVKAAFFITMPYLKKHYDLVDRMVKEGHIVGNHTVNHPSLPEVTSDDKLEQELLGLDMAFKEKTGIDMKYLRPPKGEFSERTLKISKELGYRNVFWSFAYDDWYVDKQRGAEYARKIVGDNIHNGAVLLLHAVSKDNAEAIGTIITDLKSQGYEFGTLDEIK